MSMNCHCDDCSRSVEVLALSYPFNEDDLRTSFRDLSKVWHPDRFEADSRLRGKAEEQFKLVQAAYSQVRSHFGSEVATTDARTQTVDTTTLDTQLAHSYFGHFADGRRIHLGSNLSLQNRLMLSANFEVEAPQIMAFVDLSLMKSLGTGLLFTENFLRCKSLLSKIHIDYENLREWKFELRANKTSRDIFDRMYEKLSGDSQDLSLIGTRPTLKEELHVGPPLLDTQILKIAEVLNNLTGQGTRSCN